MKVQISCDDFADRTERLPDLAIGKFERPKVSRMTETPFFWGRGFPCLNRVCVSSFAFVIGFLGCSLGDTLRGFHQQLHS